MDWTQLKNKANIFKDETLKITKKGFETSKEYAEKTGAWSYEKLKESRFVLKSTAAYEELENEKRWAIFCIQDDTPFTKDFLLLLPILFTKVWIESGSLRIVIKEISDELQQKLEIIDYPLALIKMNDGEIRKITKESEIQECMKNFTFYSK
ncbi:MAG: hypothetical protein Q8K26_04085 [Candidatus Gracilibacteria bacterium]|nr:hypothetical protein [Candidatus Gracilibacteria bacterium]